MIFAWSIFIGRCVKLDRRERARPLGGGVFNIRGRFLLIRENYRIYPRGDLDYKIRDFGYWKRDMGYNVSPIK